MEIERMVYECSKVGIEKDYSGGQIYSYTKGMKKLLADTELNLSRMADYKEPVDFEADPEKNIAPMSFTYKQMDTLFPKQFRFKSYDYGSQRLFAFSNNKMSVDWDQYADYEEYLNVRRDENAVVGGRSGSHEFYILAGDLARLEDFPCRYYQSESLKMPYTERDLCSSQKPDYMSALHTVCIGDTITKESVREFISEEQERSGFLKKMAYCLLRYKQNENCGYSRNLVICDEHETVIYWIAALSFLFSEDLAKELSFSTYEYSPMGSEYRICGAFQRGTDYDASASYRECYVFDFCNREFEEVENLQETEFYGFLVNSFLYAPESLDRFYEFISKFDFTEVSIELENAFQLYCFLYLNKADQKSPVGQLKKAADFAKYCKDNTMTKEMLVRFVNAYMIMAPREMQECEEMMVRILEHFSGYLEFLEKLCAENLASMLMPASKVKIDTIKAVYERYNSLFNKAGGNLALIYYEIFWQRADEILIHNQNLQSNIYIAQMIYRYMRDSNIEISHVSPSYTEGKMLHIIVENILRQNLPAGELRKCVKALTDFYQGDTYEYLYLIMELEGMARDYEGGSVQIWLRESEACMDDYIDSKNGDSAIKMYGALTELECKDKVLGNIEKRSRTNEKFDLLFDDVEELLKNYGKQFRESKSWIYEVLLKAAENKDNTWNSLIRILELRSDGENDKIFLEAADKIVRHMEMRAESVNLSLLENLTELYEENHMQADSKLEAIKILKEMEADLGKGRRRIVSKYGKLQLGKERIEFPKVSETSMGNFFDDYSSKVIEIYVTCENIQVVHYFNNLFQIGELETIALMEIELRKVTGEYKRIDVKLFCELLAYAVLSGCQPESGDMADILIKNKMNINKLNKCFNEKNEEILKELHAKLRIRSISKQEKMNLLAYWDEVFELAEKSDTNFMKKVMKTFFKR